MRRTRLLRQQRKSQKHCAGSGTENGPYSHKRVAPLSSEALQAFHAGVDEIEVAGFTTRICRLDVTANPVLSDAAPLPESVYGVKFRKSLAAFKPPLSRLSLF